MGGGDAKTLLEALCKVVLNMQHLHKYISASIVWCDGLVWWVRGRVGGALPSHGTSVGCTRSWAPGGMDYRGMYWGAGGVCWRVRGCIGVLGVFVGLVPHGNMQLSTKPLVFHSLCPGRGTPVGAYLVIS